MPGETEIAGGRRDAWTKALGYMDLAPGTPIAGLKVDRVFIGSRTNARFPDPEGAGAGAGGAGGAARGHPPGVPGTAHWRASVLASRAYGRNVAGSVTFSTRMSGSSSTFGMRHGAAPVARNASDRQTTGVT